MTHLSIRKGNEGVAINSSWVEPERSLAYKFRMMPVDSVQRGITCKGTGRYRRSVTLFPWPWSWKRTASTAKRLPYLIVRDRSYSPETAFSSGRRFPTIDGKRKEGIVNPTTGIGEDDKVIYKPGMPYSSDCALGYTDGATSRKDWWKPMDKPSEFLLWAGEPCCKRRHGIPAVKCPHSVNWPSSITCGMCQPSTLKGLIPPLQGEYLTCSESGKETFYLMDFSNGIVTGRLSKRYTQAKLRLFYLF